MIQAVTDAGLISEEVGARLSAESAHSQTCGAVHAAEKIVHEFMSMHEDAEKIEEQAVAVINQLKSDVENWKQSAKTPGDCEQFEQSSSCRDTTPVVLDLLLQQMNRH